jgi:hypothetical protein
MKKTIVTILWGVLVALLLAYMGFMVFITATVGIACYYNEPRAVVTGMVGDFTVFMAFLMITIATGVLLYFAWHRLLQRLVPSSRAKTVKVTKWLLPVLITLLLTSCAGSSRCTKEGCLGSRIIGVGADGRAVKR